MAKKMLGLFVWMLALTTTNGMDRSPLLPFGTVDTHVHLVTTTNGINYTWSKDPSTLNPPQKCPCRPPCLCNSTLPQYEITSKAAPADYIVFCEVSADPEFWLEEAKWVQSLADSNQYAIDDSALEAISTSSSSAQKGTKIGAILSQPPPGFGTSGVSTYAHHLDQLQQLSKFRGMRVNLAKGTQEMNIAGLKELGRRGLVADINVDVKDPAIAEIVKQSPDTSFIVEHLGCGCNVPSLAANQTLFQGWKQGIERLAALPNVKCLMVGGTMAAFKNASNVDPAMIKPLVETVVGAFGFDRLCFEANWFFCDFVDSMTGFEAWVSVLVPMLKEMGATDVDIRHLFRDNALTVYKINE